MAWLEEAELLSPASVAGVDEEHLRVSSQSPFASLEHHDMASRPDLLIEVYRSSGEESNGGGEGGSGPLRA